MKGQWKDEKVERDERQVLGNKRKKKVGNKERRVWMGE